MTKTKVKTQKNDIANRHSILALCLDIVGILCLIGIDQVTKYLAVLHLKGQAAFPIIDGILELNYLENHGAAFGMLQNQKIFFIFVAVVILGVIAYVLWKMPRGKRYVMLHILLSMIAAGAIGNMIDRIRLNYVVDFIYIVAINFPIFNVADICVTVATFLLIVLMIFFYKEKDLMFLSFHPDRYREYK